MTAEFSIKGVELRAAMCHKGGRNRSVSVAATGPAAYGAVVQVRRVPLDNFDHQRLEISSIATDHFDRKRTGNDLALTRMNNAG